MKDPNRIYSFFVVLALLFWNPVSFYLLYHNKDVYQITAIHLFYWVTFAAGIAVIIAISKNKASARGKNLVLVFAFTSVLFMLLVVVNGAIGRAKRSRAKMAAAAAAAQDDRKGGLVFEPKSTARYTTVEYDCEADINSLGLRDREISKDKNGKFRILCFGDSWTFGWGVSQENSWPHKLEEFLHKAGKTNVEVINCGRGGQYTTTYKKYLADAVPALKPDLVLVGVLEEDDLAQLYETNYVVGGKTPKKQETNVRQGAAFAANEYLHASLTNITRLINRPSTSSEPVDIRAAWKSMANNFYDNLDPIQRLRFKTLDDSVQQMFLSGNLNPGLVDAYVKFPERVAIFNNPNHPATRFAIAEMNKDIAEMKAICGKNGAQMVFINLPINFFNGHKVVRCANDVLNPYFEANNKIDSIYAAIASANGLPYMQLTEHFRALTDKEAYYFKYDGHPNERGCAEMANYIGQQLTEQDLLKTK